MKPDALKPKKQEGKKQMLISMLSKRLDPGPPHPCTDSYTLTHPFKLPVHGFVTCDVVYCAGDFFF